MRLTSDFFVSALVRRVFASGGFAAVEKKGAAEAGAVFFRQRHRDGLETLYGPAPQSLFEAGAAHDRRFEIRAGQVEAENVAAVLARETRFDPDLWIVELETDDVSALIEVVAD